MFDIREQWLVSKGHGSEGVRDNPARRDPSFPIDFFLQGDILFETSECQNPIQHAKRDLHDGVDQRYAQANYGSGVNEAYHDRRS